MKEQFLHFIWQFQYFDKKQLQTKTGDSLEVFFPGIHNFDAGPDFTEARTQIGGIDWHGDVEIHYHASDWNNHHHEQDTAYNRVVLHVVWEDDAPIKRQDGTSIPTLELKGKVDLKLINRYKELVKFNGTIPCTLQFRTVDRLTRITALDKALTQRLERKSQLVLELLKHNHQDWETTTYQFLAYNFGFRVNSDAFLSLSRSLPFKIIARQADNLTRLEALLFGMAGFLEKEEGDTYYSTLRKEFKFLAKKYKLEPYILEAHRWKFMRLRPSNFPTTRIAQFAALIYKFHRLFSIFRSSLDYNSLKTKLETQASSYWKEHYRFGKKSPARMKGMGNSSLNMLIINTAPPLLAAYSIATDSPDYMDRAVKILESMPSENNKIIRLWKALGMKSSSAFDSQALIELYNEFCKEKKCLNCKIGVKIMKKCMNNAPTKTKKE